ncbi:MAG: DUF6116 family protein [Acidobacteriota bacterium]|nr:DUF6116 family protein [Acidobacteriota bacterium]
MSSSGRVVTWFSNLRSWQLFLFAGALFVVDLLVPDPIPLIDEVMLGVTTLLMARWKRRRNPLEPDDLKR